MKNIDSEKHVTSTTVAIGRLVYILRIVLLSWGLYIMRGTGHEQSRVRGSLATSRCRRWRLPPDRWWPFSVRQGSWAFIFEESGRVSGAYKVELI